MRLSARGLCGQRPPVLVLKAVSVGLTVLLAGGAMGRGMPARDRVRGLQGARGRGEIVLRPGRDRRRGTSTRACREPVSVAGGGPTCKQSRVSRCGRGDAPAERCCGISAVFQRSVCPPILCQHRTDSRAPQRLARAAPCVGVPALHFDEAHAAWEKRLDSPEHCLPLPLHCTWIVRCHDTAEQV
jgi:hypothetical protein